MNRQQMIAHLTLLGWGDPEVYQSTGSVYIVFAQEYEPGVRLAIRTKKGGDAVAVHTLTRPGRTKGWELFPRAVLIGLVKRAEAYRDIHDLG